MDDARKAIGDAGTTRVAITPYEDMVFVVLMEDDDDGLGVSADMRFEMYQPLVTSQHTADHGGRSWHEDRPGGAARFLVALLLASSASQTPDLFGLTAGAVFS